MGSKAGTWTSVSHQSLSLPIVISNREDCIFLSFLFLCLSSVLPSLPSIEAKELNCLIFVNCLSLSFWSIHYFWRHAVDQVLSPTEHWTALNTITVQFWYTIAIAWFLENITDSLLKTCISFNLTGANWNCPWFCFSPPVLNLLLKIAGREQVPSQSYYF